MKSFQLLIVSFLILVNSAFCQDITLSWDPSPTPEVAGYKIYYQQDNANYPFDGTGAAEGNSPVDVGDTLSATLTELGDEVVYFFTVTAYSDDSESSYSNIVSNSWLPALITPTIGAANEPVPVTFLWETAPSDYDVTYTLFYGTDQTEVRTAGVIAVSPPAPGNNPLLPGTIAALVALLLLAIRYRPTTKLLPQTIALLAMLLLGGMLTACGGGGGGDSSSDHSAVTGESAQLYSVDKGSSDYHQAYDLEPSTTYYWKVVATDTQDPNLTYESEVRGFTTEAF
ncbi:MAG: fibronectin type III domain-containing protein [Desulfuromusa sp.]|nr:fibronectin type III domain-containing protein [Desulfuromusa sp.]